ncbi:uncharacterized protein EI90DRAFT_3159800 [Cantharellus anzutake]|uniref:uncharacterized protein n=1 Tax=Cantharellus anzutake TaxID=1750568 RepID=UPI001908EEDF|nr:uncharacterized protein EI90DRAFT_3159800 [Cantharellus anzutake]KAF8313028.1 hypothetical protein EI90DRAFT_3159800 [Cantharellus anzutake]
MDVKILLNMDPSDEQWTNMWESLWVSNWNLDEKPPAFIVDQQVRHGIVAVLSLTRIEEEKLRLAREELNARTWIVQSVDSMIRTTDDIHPLYKYRWQLRLKLLLKCRDAIVNGPFPCVNLWRASTHYLLANLEHSDPQAAPSAMEYSSFRLPPPGSATLSSGTHGIDPEDDAVVTNELSALTGLIRMSPEPDDNDDIDDIEPSTDSGSGPGDTLEPEIPVNHSDGEPEIRLDETMDPIDNPDPHTEPLTDLVPPHRLRDADSPGCNKSIEEKFWNENPRPQSLPPITTIFDAIRSPTQSIQQQKPTKIWKEIMELLLPQDAGKIVNESKTRDKARYYKHIAIFPDALPTVNRRRLIHGAIIDAYVEMLQDLTDEKLRDILKTTHPRVIMFPTQCEGMRHCMAVHLLDRATKKVRTDLFDASAWTIPCYSRKRSHWLLGVVNFEQRELRYLDSMPLQQNAHIGRHGPQWVFTILQGLVNATWSFIHPDDEHGYNWSNWSTRAVTTEPRQWNGYDCGVWTMADIQAIHIGLDAAPKDTNIDNFRDRVKQQILSLPPSTPRWQPTWRSLDPDLIHELRCRAAKVAATFPVNYSELEIDHTDFPLVMDDEQEQIDLTD